MAVFPLSVSLVDSMSRYISKRYDVQAADYATALTTAAAFMDDLQAVTEAEILTYVLGTKVIYASGSLTAGSNRDEGATISVRTADNERAIIRIPAPLHAFRNTDGTVDLTDVDLAAYLANYTGALILVDDGETVTGILGGKIDK